MKVEAYEYDNNTAGGDGNRTKLTRYQDATTTRVTAYGYDFRNRQTSIDGEIDFYQINTYDNLDRLTQVDRKNTTSSGNLIARSATNYDNRGRVYQQVRYAVDPSTGTVGNSLTDNFWYDPASNLIKAKEVGSSSLQKIIYDGARRMTTRYASYNTSETGYPYPVSVTNDTVFQQTELAYDAASNLIQQTTRQRMYDASGTAGLGNPSTSPTARVSYLAFYPDAIGREQARADYGTNGGSSFTRSGTIPARSDTVLVTSTSYNSRGEAYQFTIPKEP